MDPNSALQLDPKLKETYNKIMGFSPDNTTSAPTANDPTANQPNFPLPDANATATAIPTPAAEITNPLQTPPPVQPENQTPTQPLNAIPNNILDLKPEANNALAPTENKEVKPEKLKEDKNNPEVHGFIAHNNNEQKISPIILVLAAVVLLIAYALFWIKLLNLHIPALGI